MNKNTKKIILCIFLFFGLMLILSPRVSAARLNYTSLCSTDANNAGIRQSFRTLGYFIAIAKWIVPFILIVFGMIDFGKVVISGDDKAINKATYTIIKRVIAGIIVFFIPTIMLALMHLFEFVTVYRTAGNFNITIKDDRNDSFGACTKCLFDPFKSCP